MVCAARFQGLLSYLDLHAAGLQQLRCQNLRELLRTGEARPGRAAVPERAAWHRYLQRQGHVLTDGEQEELRAREAVLCGHFRKVKFSQGLNCVAGAVLSQGRAHISWQAQHFRKVKQRFRGRRSTFARLSRDFVAGAALSQGQVHNSWQVQHFRKVKCTIRGRRITFARSSTDFVAGAALPEGQVEISWQAQHFCSRGSKIATFKYESSTRSQLSQLGLEHRNF